MKWMLVLALACPLAACHQPPTSAPAASVPLLPEPPIEDSYHRSVHHEIKRHDAPRAASIEARLDDLKDQVKALRDLIASRHPRQRPHGPPPPAAPPHEPVPFEPGHGINP